MQNLDPRLRGDDVRGVGCGVGRVRFVETLNTSFPRRREPNLHALSLHMQNLDPRLRGDDVWGVGAVRVGFDSLKL